MKIRCNLVRVLKIFLMKKHPQVYDAANFSYDPRQHDPRGRLTYIGLIAINLHKVYFKLNFFYS